MDARWWTKAAVVFATLGLTAEAHAQDATPDVPAPASATGWDEGGAATDAPSIAAPDPAWGDAPLDEAPKDEVRVDDAPAEVERRPNASAPGSRAPVAPVWPSYWGGAYPAGPYSEEGWEPAPNDPDRTDPLLPTGLTLGGVGLALLVGGLAWRQTASGPEYCGLSGCFHTKDTDERLSASTLMIAGAATLVTGGSVALAGLGGSPPDGVRRSERMMTTGVVITTGGIASAVSGATLIFAATRGEDVSAWQPIGSFVGAAAGLGLGIPLWAVGARKRKGPLASVSMPTLTFDGRGVSCITRF